MGAVNLMLGGTQVDKFQLGGQAAKKAFLGDALVADWTLPTPFFEINNMFGVTQLGSGTLDNESTVAKNFIDNTGAIVDTDVGELIPEKAERVSFNNYIQHPGSRGRVLPALTNYFLNVMVPVTQTIDTAIIPNGDYTCFVKGAGTVTLSGGATGVASEASLLQVTNTGSITFTVEGGPTAVNFVAGKHRFPVFIPSTLVASSWDADDIRISSVDTFTHDQSIFLSRITWKSNTVTQVANIGIRSDSNTTSVMYINTTPQSRSNTVNGENLRANQGTLADGDDVLLSLCTIPGVGRSLLVSVNSGAFVGEDGTADGSYTDSGILRVLQDAPGTLHQSTMFFKDNLSNMSLADMKQFVIDNAHNLTAAA